MASSEVWHAVLQRLGVKPGTAELWAAAFTDLTPGYFGKGVEEMDFFLGQVLHESAHLEHLEENLDYSPQRLMAVWPKRFPDMTTALDYAHNGAKLAGRVYGNRLGNTEPGDGWKFRGSGLLQVTGRDNFAYIEATTRLPVLENPDLLRRPGPEAVKAAVAIWHRLVKPEMVGDILAVTRAINGGLLGLEERQKLTHLASQENGSYAA